MNLIRALVVFALSLVMAATVSAQDAKQSLASPRFDVTPLIIGGLLDPAAPIEHRRELAKRLIEAADREKSPVLLYYVGSLYRQGDWAGIAPFPKDVDRAREYLTRAALGGFINAMSKMAVVELDSGNQFEANLWAQLYSYYSAINDPSKPAASHGYQRPTSHESLSSKLLRVWPFDGWPEQNVLRVLRPIVDGIPFSPAPEGTTDSRVVLIPVVFANPNYRLKQDGDKK